MFKSHLSIKPAASKLNKFDLSYSHLTTCDFGQCLPILSRPLIPRDNFDVSTSLFSRNLPLDFPLYGRAFFRLHSFFVPFHTLADDFEAWVSGQNQLSNALAVTRKIRLATLFSALSSSKFSTAGTSSSYDFAWAKSSTDLLAYYKFTPLGRYIYKVLTQLGYAIPKTAPNYSLTNSVVFNAFPLLAYVKAYNDWLSNSVFYSSSITSKALADIKSLKIDSLTPYIASDGNLTYSFITNCLSEISALFDDDFLTTAWNSPLSASGFDVLQDRDLPAWLGDKSNAPSSDFSAFDNSGNVKFDVDGVTLDTNEGSVSQYKLNVLRQLQLYLQRNNVSGSRDVSRLYARFGIKVSDFDSNFSEYLGSKDIDLQVSDVTATTAATDQELGSYSGKGISSGTFDFKFESSDYGMLITICSLKVRSAYVNRCDPFVFALHPFDYYTPEFDGQFPQPINDAQVNFTTLSSTVNQYNSIFGFVNKYDDYRNSLDLITGDFASDEVLKSWHFGRYFASVPPAQDASFTNMNPVNSPFNRVFSVDTGLDHFYLAIYHKISALRPILSSENAFGLQEGDLDIKLNGNSD